MEHWNTFIRSEYANEVLMVVGGVIILFSVLKIISGGFKMFCWVLLAFIGSVSLSYGFQHSPYDLPALDRAQLSDLTRIAAEGNKEVISYLCERLNLN